MNIRNTYLNFLTLVAVVIMTLISCAKIGSLTGGPQDKVPPQLDTLTSTKNFQTRFTERKVTLFFDEWIELKNKNQILISPPLKYLPEMEVKGKSVVFELNEKELLRDSTTYVINFGNSIVDFNEANPVRDFKFIFSTGDKIDSLTYSGKVSESYTYKPLENITVMLYDTNRDSVVVEEVPYYFGKTDKQGLFRINNIKKGSYKCVALEDKDFNYMYNPDIEKIGFLDSMILIGFDTLEAAADIEVFLANPTFRLTDKSIRARGKISVKASQPIDSFRVVYSNMPFFDIQKAGDSLIFWYTPLPIPADSVYIEFKVQNLADTIRIKTRSTTPVLPGLKMSGNNLRKKLLYPEDTLKVQWNQPLQHLNRDLITILEKQDTVGSKAAKDSFAVFPPARYNIQLDSLVKNQLLVNGQFLAGKKYSIQFFPESVHSYLNYSNDSLIITFEREKKENLGSITCHFEDLDSTAHYVVLLMLQNVVVDKEIIVNSSNYSAHFRQLVPGNYKLEVILDKNRNKRWDPGDYFKKIQPEKKLEITLEELRKNWDLETKIKWDKE